MKFLREIYKIREGAHKRACFENGVAPGEFKRGDKARLYRYSVIEQNGAYRVARFDDTLQAKLRAHGANKAKDVITEIADAMPWPSDPQYNRGR